MNMRRLIISASVFVDLRFRESLPLYVTAPAAFE